MTPPQTCGCDQHPEHPCGNAVAHEGMWCGDACRYGTCTVVVTDGYPMPWHGPTPCGHCAGDDQGSTSPCTCAADCGADLCEARPRFNPLF